MSMVMVALKGGSDKNKWKVSRQWLSTNFSIQSCYISQLWIENKLP
jgi:hypothetical protein